jgi:hypothetical protein
LEPLEQLDNQDHQDPQEPQVQQEVMGEQGPLVHQVIQAHKDLLELQVNKVELVQQDSWEQLGLLGLQAQQVFLEDLVQQVKQARQAPLDLQEPRVILELLVSMELQAVLEKQVQLGKVDRQV